MIRNVIQALGHPKTRGKAYWFIKSVVGKRTARKYLVPATKSANPKIRAAAKSLLK